MKNYIIETTLKITGFFIFFIGFFVSIIIGWDCSDYMYFVIGALICFLIGIFFFAIGEIISLLRKNVEKQNELIAILNQKEKE